MLMASIKPGIASVSREITPSFASTEITLPRTEYCLADDCGEFAAVLSLALLWQPTAIKASKKNPVVGTLPIVCLNVFFLGTTISLFVEQPVIVEAVANLAVNLARGVVVKSAEGQAVVEQHAMIGGVDDIYIHRCILPKCLPQRYAQVR